MLSVTNYSYIWTQRAQYRDIRYDTIYHAITKQDYLSVKGRPPTNRIHRYTRFSRICNSLPASLRQPDTDFRHWWQILRPECKSTPDFRAKTAQKFFQNIQCLHTKKLSKSGLSKVTALQMDVSDQNHYHAVVKVCAKADIDENRTVTDISMSM